MKTAAALCMFLLLAVIRAEGQNVRLISKPAEKRVDVTVDGRLFTSYRWDEKYQRPVLFPVMAAGGTFITRGFPFETRDGESVDHPHQVGCSLSYGSVNGVDFWNTSTFRSATELEKMGRIVHKSIVSAKSGHGQASLVTKSIWTMPDGKPVLFETTAYRFHVIGRKRWIDRETTLTASNGSVVFGDSKEGMFAIRIATELEQADQIAVKVTDRTGVVSERKPNAGNAGRYFNSEGLSGDKVWGTLGKWGAVAGKLGGEAVTVALFDHPKNKNFPSYMMIRGYGLLALNPFGQKLFDPEKEERKFTLKAKQSIRFQHRLLILPEDAARETVEKEYLLFAK